jgi:DNA mismatch repair protein MutS
LQAIGALIDKGLHGALHDLLAHVGDVERGLARVALKSARPRDLAQLREALARLPELQRLLAGVDSPGLADLATRAGTYPDIHALLVRAIVEQPPPILREGGVIALGYDAELDELKRISEHSDQYLLEPGRRASASAAASRTCASATTACRVTTSRSIAASPTACRRTITVARR